ncbi:hypothetical protein NF699_09665 [Sphingomonadaceae bacterium OTU29LAMAA1]|nr:hypothetical protein NF699_09665 [Sphingomonadaceae bacterium OTU29LAMAA1]
MADHGAAALIAVTTVVVAAVITAVVAAPIVTITPVVAISAMVALLIATTVVITALCIGAARCADGSGHHTDGGEDRGDFHAVSFDGQLLGRRGHYAVITTSFLTYHVQGRRSSGDIDQLGLFARFDDLCRWPSGTVVCRCLPG